MHNLALLLKETDPQAALLWWERAVEAGDSDAMFNLGLHLAETDPKAARVWYERAVEAGHVEAIISAPSWRTAIQRRAARCGSGVLKQATTSR
jgi:TPR repeat protein